MFLYFLLNAIEEPFILDPNVSITNAFFDSCKRGDINYVRTFIKEHPHLLGRPPYRFEDGGEGLWWAFSFAFSDAVVAEQTEIVDYFLQFNQPVFPWFIIQEGLQGAAIAGNERMITKILDSNYPYVHELRLDHALQITAHHGRLNTIKQLAKLYACSPMGSILENFRLCLAEAINAIDIVQGKNIFHEDLSHAGHLEVRQWLEQTFNIH